MPFATAVLIMDFEAGGVAARGDDDDDDDDDDDGDDDAQPAARAASASDTTESLSMWDSFTGVRGFASSAPEYDLASASARRRKDEPRINTDSTDREERS